MLIATSAGCYIRFSRDSSDCLSMTAVSQSTRLHGVALLRPSNGMFGIIICMSAVITVTLDLFVA